MLISAHSGGRFWPIFHAFFDAIFGMGFGSPRGAIFMRFGTHFHDVFESGRARQQRKWIFAKHRFALQGPAKIEVRGARRSSKTHDFLSFSAFFSGMRFRSDFGRILTSFRAPFRHSGAALQASIFGAIFGMPEHHFAWQMSLLPHPHAPSTSIGSPPHYMRK